MTYKRQKCPRNTCLPCDARRRKGPSLSAGALLAAGGRLRVRDCPIHGDRIAPDSDEDRAFQERSIGPRVAPPAEPMRLRARAGAVRADGSIVGAVDDDRLRKSVLLALWVDT